MNLQKTILLLTKFKKAHPKANKADIENEFILWGAPRIERSVFLGDGFAVRFCEANTASFSNVVLSLSALQRYDSLPTVICIVRHDRLEFRLANATFLKRISHSSHSLRTDNIRGSFLGHDIMDQYETLANVPENFDRLFAIHSEFTWEENVERLVESTNAIVARSTRFEVTPDILMRLLESPARAAKALMSPASQKAERQLRARIEAHNDELLRAAALDNVNIRGNAIEQVITGEVNAHRLDDMVFKLDGGENLVVDIKTKLLDRASAPKAYNIDKMLRLLAEPGNVFSIFFVGIDGVHQHVHTRLVSVFDAAIIRATRTQAHWAGRSSRGAGGADTRLVVSAILRSGTFRMALWQTVHCNNSSCKQ